MIMQRALAVVAVTTAAASLAACEATQETSKRLSKNAKKLLNAEGLKVTKQNGQIKVSSTESLSDANGTAVVVNLKNSGATQLNVPIAIAVLGRKKKKLIDNSLAGLDASLISAAAVEKGTSFWVNNQLQTSSKPQSVNAKIGASTERPKGPLPKILLSKLSFKTDVSGIYYSGIITNKSKIVQKRLVVSCVSRVGGRLKAAGRAIVERLMPAPTPKPTPIRVYFIGNPTGGAMSCQAPPTTITGEAS